MKKAHREHDVFGPVISKMVNGHQGRRPGQFAGGFSRTDGQRMMKSLMMVMKLNADELQKNGDAWCAGGMQRRPGNSGRPSGNSNATPGGEIQNVPLQQSEQYKSSWFAKSVTTKCRRKFRHEECPVFYFQCFFLLCSAVAAEESLSTDELKFLKQRLDRTCSRVLRLPFKKQVTRGGLRLDTKSGCCWVVPQGRLLYQTRELVV